MTDTELIRRYLEGTEGAFEEIVRRYVDLVYSVARRVAGVGMAEEVVQSVFIKLSLKAGTLKTGVPLDGWLYLVARHTALDAVRQEARRRVREQAAFEISAMNSKSPEWTQVEAVLDEAMEALPEGDRRAVLLRFFENRSLREVGEALGATENAAQKRVGRALEGLRELFERRGVRVSSAGLAAGLAGNAIQGAPAGLVASASALAAITAAPVPAMGGIILMTTIQKSIAVAAILAAGGFAYYEHARSLEREARVRVLEKQAVDLAAAQANLRRERNEAEARSAGLEARARAAEVASLTLGATPVAEVPAPVVSPVAVEPVQLPMPAVVKRPVEVPEPAMAAVGREVFHENYASLVRRLALTAEQAADFQDIFLNQKAVQDRLMAVQLADLRERGLTDRDSFSAAANEARRVAGEDFDSRVTEQLGAEALRAYKEYNATINSQFVANNVQKMLAATDYPLPVTTVDRVADIIRANRPPEPRGRPQTGAELAAINVEEILRQAATVLSAPQVAVLKKELAEYVRTGATFGRVPAPCGSVTR